MLLSHRQAEVRSLNMCRVTGLNNRRALGQSTDLTPKLGLLTVHCPLCPRGLLHPMAPVSTRLIPDPISASILFVQELPWTSLWACMCTCMHVHVGKYISCDHACLRACVWRAEVTSDPWSHLTFCLFCFASGVVGSVSET